MRRKGELTTGGIDRGWPHQAALPNTRVSAEFNDIHAFCAGLSLAPRGLTFVRPADGYMDVFCFAEAEHAQRFIARFGAEPIDPKTRPRWPAKTPRRAAR
ncbi:hypothetical protein [Hyphomicrobium sp. CS1BSMeth3]|uniref:hypothetical protein n=1 Tax=Hyphomicrobium sp. CS1BSMeth3 TaxID=1892844 RepID=UPI0009F95C0F|nr:hypothetical protein [Hyphomicrobium sp. CS1BSMeth3]